MSSLYIEPEVYAGTSIEDAANAACALAWRMGCDVWIQFNGIRVLAKPGTHPDKFVQAWKDAMDGKRVSGAFSTGGKAAGEGEG